MGTTGFGHIDLRVRNLAEALPLYSALMPTLGFSGERTGQGWHTFVGSGTQPGQQALPMAEDKQHAPNANRIAFCVDSRSAVDHLASITKAAGASIESGPRGCTEYWPTYYAFFFEDACGNKLEVCHLLD
jgi:catechol 2,3-dioxygenase-like lactoylglutathione lyase family enzyme